MNDTRVKAATNVGLGTIHSASRLGHHGHSVLEEPTVCAAQQEKCLGFGRIPDIISVSEIGTHI
jgi:hypothetical protein